MLDTEYREDGKLRAWVSTHMPIITFLVAYFFTIVLGNLLFVSPIAPTLLRGYPQEMYEFKETFSFGFWLLLFLPFLVAPPAYIVGRRALQRSIVFVANRTIPFSMIGYAIVLSLLLAFVSREMASSGIFQLVGSGTTAIASVEARFEILARLGFPTLIVLQALLTFMAFIALISAMRSGHRLWWVLTAVSIGGTSVGLVMLNMKWPVVLFYLGIMLSTFMFARRWIYVSTILCGVLLLCVYLLISSYVFRLGPSQEMPTPVPTSSKVAPDIEIPVIEIPIVVPSAFAKASRLAISAFSESPFLIRAAVFRMSLGYPYYYHVFTSEGPVCGGIVEQARIGPNCRPSKLIYARMYGADGFEGRGTSGSSVHISAYALGGWPLAVIGLVAASMVLAAFSCLPLNGNTTIAALRTIGAIAGYHFSQLPGEGVFLYDHGLLWLLLLIVAYNVSARVVRHLTGKGTARV